MIDQQPSFRCLDRNRTCTHLQALPCTHFERSRSHHMTMFSPETHIGRFAVEDIAERCMPVITRTTQHGKITVDLTREHHTVTVERQIRIFQLVECFEIERISYTDCRAVIAVAPGDDVTGSVESIFILPYNISTPMSFHFFPSSIYDINFGISVI